MSLGSGFRFLTALGGHIKLHCAVEVEVGDLRAVKQDDVLGSILGGVFDPFFKVMDLHALFKGGGCIVLHERCVAVVLLHRGKTILVEIEVLAVTVTMTLYDKSMSLTMVLTLSAPKKWEWRVRYT